MSGSGMFPAASDPDKTKVAAMPVPVPVAEPTPATPAPIDPFAVHLLTNKQQLARALVRVKTLEGEGRADMVDANVVKAFGLLEHLREGGYKPRVVQVEHVRIEVSEDWHAPTAPVSS